jgi:hypothetical protein
MRIIRAILEGERDREKLALMRAHGVKSTPEAIAKALVSVDRRTLLPSKVKLIHHVGPLLYNPISFLLSEALDTV